MDSGIMGTTLWGVRVPLIQWVQGRPCVKIWRRTMRFGHLSLDLLFPPSCDFCSNQTVARSPVCADCRAKLTCVDGKSACKKCGVFFIESDYSKCPECAVRSFRFHRAVALSEYEGDVRRAVIRLKNFSQFHLSRSLGRLMNERLDQNLLENKPDLAIPIPKYWMKRLVKGANSTELLAQEIATCRQIPSFPHALRWNRNIKKQSLLSTTERKQNVRGALELSNGYDLKGTHVLLVDDTLTTGATANEATKCLLEVGVAEVTVCVVGRAANHS